MPPTQLRTSIKIILLLCAGNLSCAGMHAALGTPHKSITLNTRWRADTGPEAAHRSGTVEWAAGETAIIVCDMWDDHWCKGAAERVAELAGPMNRLLNRTREDGVFVIHAPSSVVEFYAGTEQRRRAQEADFSPTPVPLSTAERWGTSWCWPDPDREPGLPIDDSDMGCDCPIKCEIREAWTRQNEQIEIWPQDAISHDGQETWNLLAERGIDNVILVGVHLNMCVLGRPFGIRQMVHLGKNVVLLRDMTDSMYDHRMRPFVDHFAGHDLVIEHVEQHWCPSALSSDLTGEAPFRFAEAPRN
jgi:nicotinamidase-related amidase